MHEEFEKLKDVFCRNGYPGHFIEGIISKFLHKKFDPPARMINDEEDKRFILRIPYIGRPSLEFRNRISRLIKDMYKVNFTCVFQSTKVSNFFSLKCPTNPYLLSNVVYRFRCRDDPAVMYIGETKRHIGTRATEHLNINKSLTTAVGSHIKECVKCRTDLINGDISYKDFDVILSGRSKFDIEVAESMLVK